MKILAMYGRRRVGKYGGRDFLTAKNLHNYRYAVLGNPKKRKKELKTKEPKLGRNEERSFLETDVGMQREVVAVDKGVTSLSLGKENEYIKLV